MRSNCYVAEYFLEKFKCAIIVMWLNTSQRSKMRSTCYVAEYFLEKSKCAVIVMLLNTS